MCLEQFGPLIAYTSPLNPKSLIPNSPSLSIHSAATLNSLSLAHEGQEAAAVGAGEGRRAEAVGGCAAAGCGRPASGARTWAGDGRRDAPGMCRVRKRTRGRPAAATRGRRPTGRRAAVGDGYGAARFARADRAVVPARHDRAPVVSCLGYGGGTACRHGMARFADRAKPCRAQIVPYPIGLGSC